MNYKNTINAITINALAFVNNEHIHLYSPIINAFNVYSKNNNFDINFHITILSPKNSTSERSHFEDMIESLLLKQSTKYDIYFYYGLYNKNLGVHFVDLNNYLSKEHIELYDSNILSKLCYNNNRLVGLVMINNQQII
ncbi:hypothetical protein PIROE2DRAFT_1138 [Piromyces sp. E2]|nr:hypothetical protein PIROE2DRAFT_1138 [Piromyces sp. E2]|eukprot:OUM70612.1 hypothetical protein PIROE2DRAFT_1138 [Piromyces sp. E2]